MEEPLSVIHCVLEGDAQQLEQILTAGADVNQRDERERTGLHLAAERGRSDMLQLLLAHNADIFARDHHGNTALHVCGHLETVTCLLSYGASVQDRNNHGDTAQVILGRRGVEKKAVELLQRYQQKQQEAVDQPLDASGNRLPTDTKNAVSKTIPNPTNSQSTSSIHSTVTGPSALSSPVTDIWYEFCSDLGPVRLALLLVVILCVSLTVAYMSTDMARMYDIRIPIDAEELHTEL